MVVRIWPSLASLVDVLAERHVKQGTEAERFRSVRAIIVSDVGIYKLCFSTQP